MLQIDKVQRIEGVTVFGDHRDIGMFYLVAEMPTVRRTPQGKLSFSFFKYRFPVNRPDGKKGGGFLLFDVAFLVEPENEAKVREVLEAQVHAEANRRNISPPPPVRFGTISYTKGSVSLIIAGSNGTFVEKIQNSGATSLYGDNTSTFGVELTPEGATFFEEAMQGEGPSVGVEQDLTFIARLPPVSVRAGFRASEFYSFYQTIDVDWNLWREDSYRETVREMMISSESVYFTADWGMLTDDKIRGQIRDWAMRAVEDATERKMIEAIAPVPDDERKRPEKIENVTRDITKHKISSYTLRYTEATPVEWNIRPNGPLPNITTMRDPNGNLYKWADYARTIDLDDPFFRTIRVNVLANASFKELPIHSVQVMLSYRGRPMPNMTPGEPDGSVMLRTPDQIGKFATFVDQNDWKYDYRYQINYTGQARSFVSPTTKTEQGDLVIGVDDIGILSVNVSAGDINWTDVERALVTFSYEDRDVPRIERQFQLTAQKTSESFQDVIFQPMRRNYEYQVKYFMTNGKEIVGDKQTGRARNLFINDVFSARRNISVRSVADFQQRVRTIFLDLVYDDPANEYRQTHSIALDQNTTFFDWSFPLISQSGGELSYSGTVAFRDGTSETLERKVAQTDTIIVPEPVEDVLKVELISDLVEWSIVRLVRVSLSYEDPDNNIVAQKDYVLSQTRTNAESWQVELKDRSNRSYNFSITYFMADNTRNTVAGTTSDPMLILDPFQ